MIAAPAAVSPDCYRDLSLVASTVRRLELLSQSWSSAYRLPQFQLQVQPPRAALQLFPSRDSILDETELSN